MPSKALIMVGLTIGSTAGGYVPVLFGASFLSAWSIVGSALGGLLGIYLAYRFTSDY